MKTLMMMKKIIFRFIPFVWLMAPGIFISCSTHSTGDNPPDNKNLNVLLFSKTQAYRHECIEPAGAALKTYLTDHNITSTQSEDSSLFTMQGLSPFDVVVFFQTTGNILDSNGQIAFEQYIQSGKGFVGIHAAADTEYDWPWYAGLVGAQFASHPDIQQATLQKTDTSHIACKHFPDRWSRTDEWYNFKQAPVNVQVLLTIDEATYQGGTMGANHPMSWCHDYEGGRAFYTALGHTVESYQDTLFLEHIRQAVMWAAKK
jgi:type 1 glutamine amidotransferase